MIPRAFRCLISLFFLGFVANVADAQRVIKPRAGLEPVVERLEAFIEREMKQQGLPAVSISVVDGREVVWSRGFGDAKKSVQANAETLHRVGSVSKLFTDLAVMQLVEKGELDLDAPVTTYLPDFRPKNRFGTPITLRHLMSHRAGLVRESPVGNYFDPTSPSLADTVASLNATELVYAPGTRTKYSNAGVAVVGRVVEKVKGRPFASYVKEMIIDPLGMKATTFQPTHQEMEQLSDGLMWTYDGRTFAAPTFLLGTGPAGNLYSTVNDMGRFIIAMLDGGRGVVKSETLKKMWTPQFAEKNAKTGFGIGFDIQEIDGHRHIGHNGAIYGFATDVSLMPEEKLGVAVVITKDCANSTASRISHAAYRLLIAHKKGEKLPVMETTKPLDPGMARKLDGRYAEGEVSFDLIARDDRLYLMSARGGFRFELRQVGESLLTDDPLGFGLRLERSKDAISIRGTKYNRMAVKKPSDVQEKWGGLIGEYGWDHNTLYILEKDGHLFALIEWFLFDRLEEVSADVFRFPKSSGLYADESLKFTRDAKGKATQVEAASVKFVRRKIDGDDGTTFRVTPTRPVSELRPAAMKASPPAPPAIARPADLVDLTTLDPSIKLDIRYASTNNFLSTPFYLSSRAFMQRPAAEAVAKVHHQLKAQGYGLLIHDAYRPWYVSKMFWDATPVSAHEFVADPAKGSKHNRGCAVDLTLFDLKTGKPIEMVGGYDEFSRRSSPDYPGGTSLQRWHRELLRHAMEAEGFTVNEVEWWHFDYVDWSKYPILNAAFEDIGKDKVK